MKLVAVCIHTSAVVLDPVRTMSVYDKCVVCTEDIWVQYYNTLEISRILSTNWLVLATEYTVGCEICKCNQVYFNWF